MKIEEIKGLVPYEIIESVTARGINEFTPPQELAIKKGLFSGKNMVVASPTASGKTLVAELACANAIIAKGKKAVYIAPLKALASEKYEEFKNAYPYIKTAISIGDLDSSDEWLSSYSMIFASTEKFDSLMRHGIDWLESIGCVVFDEIHMLGDISRGPTLELLIARIKETSDAQIIALSATIGNSRDIAEWLNASLVESDYRPIKVKKGIVYNSKLYYDKNGRMAASEMLEGTSKNMEERIAEDTLIRKKQLLSFYSSRRNAEAAAVRLSNIAAQHLSNDEKAELDALSKRIENVLASPTDQCKRLASLVRRGIAFHHAGLVNEQRALIEEHFKKGTIKILCATTTLALGINLPAHTVLVKDVYRYNGSGSAKMEINEMVQLFGRAGRPRYDTEGRALLIAPNKNAIKELASEYFNAELMPIDSAIGIVPVLRTHILAFIAESLLNTREAISKFLMKTFYGYQYNDADAVRDIVDSVIHDLISWGFAEENGSIRATRIGKRVSELYIDPMTAKWLIEMLNVERDEMDNLLMLSNTLEMRPHVRPSEEALAAYVEYTKNNPNAAKMAYSYESLGIEYEPEKAFATALMLKDWINEVREDELSEKHRITPGELYAKLTNAEWIAYSSIELAKLLHVSQRDLVDLFVRLKYGIREELLDLVRLEGIGRVRARLLYSNGIKTVNDIRSNREKTALLLGREIAEKVFSQL